ncbi:hypothetical protein NL676_029657 [Syzygium grande]|nr:hypothetical protein NL676_029657 [Syzygium grande]
MVLVDVELMVVVTRVVDMALFRVEVVEAVIEVLVVIALAIVLIAKGLDIQKLITTLVACVVVEDSSALAQLDSIIVQNMGNSITLTHAEYEALARSQQVIGSSTPTATQKVVYPIYFLTLQHATPGL